MHNTQKKPATVKHKIPDSMHMVYQLRYPVLSIILLILWNQCSSQEAYRFDRNILKLDNGLVTRTVKLSGDSIGTEKLVIAGSNINYLTDRSPEFSFIMNDRIIDGSSGWKFKSCTPASDENRGSGAKLELTGIKEADGIEIQILYLTYPGLPLIRKMINFKNVSSSDIKLEGVDIENISTNLDFVTTWIYHNYARMKHLGTYVGNWDDPVIVLHNTSLRAGLALGNEAPGILKRTAYHTKSNNAEIGLTHPDQDFPFRKWISPGESWMSPATFIAPYSDTDDGYHVINSVVNDFVRKHMGTRLSAIRDKPLFVYDTWNPFRTFLSDSLVREIAKAASECGIKEFLIDDGWEYNYGAKSSEKGWGANYGDWLVDLNKFPDGLKSTFDYIRSLGMRPGLWISLGSATADSRVFKDHPEWFVVNRNGKQGNVHIYSADNDFFTSCFGTEWVSYIKSLILKMVKEYGLAYAKLDLAVVTGAYVNDPSVSGCYASDHPYHRDHEESYITIYRNVLKLFDELHEEAPDLFIDCSFETAGRLQLQDYGFVRHAEGNWLSNIEEPFPTGALRVRQLAWWKSSALPAGSLVIGNLPLDSKNIEFDLKSLIGTLPVMLGDPRKLTPGKRDFLRKWSLWMENMENKYNYMIFRQELPGFCEPAEGYWDGWARINTDTGDGGIIGIFRQGAKENTRRVFIDGLDDESIYRILLAPDGKEVISLSGEHLSEEGFQVKLDKDYDAAIFEIRRLQ